MTQSDTDVRQGGGGHLGANLIVHHSNIEFPNNHVRQTDSRTWVVGLPSENLPPPRTRPQEQGQLSIVPASQLGVPMVLSLYSTSSTGEMTVSVAGKVAQAR